MKTASRRVQDKSARLFCVENYIEQQQADGGEDDVIAEQKLDPERRVAVAGEDGACGEHHGQKRRHEDGKKNERQQQFAVAARDGERGEEGSVGHQCPGSQRQHKKQLPGLALDVQVVEDEKDRRKHQLDDGNKEEVGDHLGQKQV